MKNNNDTLVMLLRKSGHHLHHNVGPGKDISNEELLSALSEEEKEQLIALLEKCTQNWGK